MAFVVATDAAPDTDALLSAVRAWLPEQAVPSAVRIVDAFPLDANGKVDRAALLRTAAEPARQAGPSGNDGPGESGWDDGGSDGGATDSERLVLRLVRDLLDSPGAGLGDDFAAAGGTSLVASRLLAAIEKETGVRLRAPELLRQPDLRAVAAVLDKRRAATTAVL
ncbi:phosphopantetheine-binding protein [Streptomyces sp. NPDC056437]|uniref:phosphopantetheine-binding protein n=1 Tax=Streptomyces sp. NPDC056437 TaxID=3345816 RepID=UPI0036D1AFF9